jgi:hypothetical protein
VSLSAVSAPKWQIGIGTHNQSIFSDSEDWAGVLIPFIDSKSTSINYSSNSTKISGRYFINNNIGVDSNYYLSSTNRCKYIKTRNSIDTVISCGTSGTASGYEMNFLLGTSLIDRGWYGYTGLGYFLDVWEGTNINKTFQGFQSPLAFGYQFKDVSMEMSLTIRSNGVYKEVFNNTDGINFRMAFVSSISLYFNF